MAKSVAIEQQAAQLEGSASGMLAKMAKRVYVRRFSGRDEGNRADKNLSSPSSKKNTGRKNDPPD